MIGNRFTQVGLDRLVRLVWLEKVSSLVLAGNEAHSIKMVLQNDLQGMFCSQRTDVRGSLDKTITILMKVWLTVPHQIKLFRDDGVELLKHSPHSEHLAIHWGMLMATYPFWSGVAIQVGRLLKLQGSVTAAHVQRRVREQYGERETVSRRARYVLRSYLDWGVLIESGTKGVYKAGVPLIVDDIHLTAWLVEASLLARENKTAPLNEIIEGPNLFPFKFNKFSADTLVSHTSRLEILRHGLDNALIMLRKSSTKGVSQ